MLRSLLTLPLTALLSLALTADAFAASATSDALILLNPDGRSYTVQHTIASDELLIALQLPKSAQLQQVSFLGPNQSRHEESFLEQPDQLQLWDGAALVRYADAYTDEVTQTGPEAYRLTLPSLPLDFAVERGQITRSSLTWVLPDSFELLSYSSVADDVGRWDHQGQTLAYEQSDSFAVTLTIEYRARQPTIKQNTRSIIAAQEAFCFPTVDEPDRCAPDNDKDSIPDYRDICLTDTTTPAADENETDIAATDDQDDQSSDWYSLFGCADTENLVLDEIQFPSGYSYLDADSRESLDRVAEALHQSDAYFEIGAHTDNAGNAKVNLSLANKRADTVRYYLLLKGVDPNQVRAKGYGEQYPIADNSTSDGRRRNRRIELSVLQ